MFAITDLMLIFESEGMVAQYYIPNFEEVMNMIKKNIFRPLPNTNRGNLSIVDTGIEEEEQKPDPSWIHIRGIYYIFLELVKHDDCDDETLNKLITPNFISELLQLFDSDNAE